MPLSRRKIAAITGCRSDYGPMRPVFRAIEACGMELSLLVTGMHLLPEYGMSVKEIERDGFAIARRLSMHLGEDTGAAMAKSLGLGMWGIAGALEELKPDILLLQGDRGEMLAGAVAGAHANVPVVHMSGGDYSGSIDDSIRSAITKFAHVHLTTCEESAARVRAMGEDPGRIFVVGEPTVDIIKAFKPADRQSMAETFGLDTSRPLILVTQHAVTSETDTAAMQMRETMEALSASGEQAFITYPNTDAGGRAMIKVIEEYKDNDNFHISRNVPHDTYLSLMSMAAVMAGNSSSGIIEAPSFRLPAVNIGNRQFNRVRACNVIDTGYDRKEVLRGLQKALYDDAFRSTVDGCVNPYGDGHAAEKTAGILNGLRLTRELCEKWRPCGRIME